jgi:hypothetical protein
MAHRYSHTKYSSKCLSWCPFFFRVAPNGVEVKFEIFALGSHSVLSNFRVIMQT